MGYALEAQAAVPESGEAILMPRSRPKGINGEREAADLWTDAGFTVRGLEAGGDHLIVADEITLAQEVKRCERLKIPEWQRQLYRDAPAGTLAVLTYRQNRGEWYSVLRTSGLVELVARAVGS